MNNRDKILLASAFMMIISFAYVLINESLMAGASLGIGWSFLMHTLLKGGQK